MIKKISVISMLLILTLISGCMEKEGGSSNSKISPTKSLSFSIYPTEITEGERTKLTVFLESEDGTKVSQDNKLWTFEFEEQEDEIILVEEDGKKQVFVVGVRPGLIKVKATLAASKGNNKKTAEATLKVKGLEPLLQFEDLSVNQASVTLTGGKLSLHIFESVLNPLGGFNGGGRGNKAILGINNTNSTLVSDLETLSFESKIQIPGSNAGGNYYINAIVDLECDGATRKIIAGEIINSIPVLSIDEEGYSLYKFNKSDKLWKVVGGLVKNGETVLHSHLSSIKESLERFSSYYPNACLVKANTLDGGMPKGKETSSLMIIVGGSTTLTEMNVLLKSIKINDTSLRFEE